ncbi:hypothetical protein [Marinobacter sp. SS8-8]|nr:hypothetical protein [Marinobacter sp. SS8-8]|tara:strand:+ start:36431 stop:36559 length:129 start_codon:yes stop_codon:yes gene_type:complete
MDTEEDHGLIARQIGMLRKRIVLTKRMLASFDSAGGEDVDHS